MKNVRCYLVGGYVRDKILGIKSNDRDYCVVGATPQDMIDAGMQQVGAEFPVFIDEKGEEYALARTERKNGKGYHGFEVQYSPDVTLKEDLGRRDLTINAIAMDSKGEYIDPYNGIDDIENKILRHVNDSFKEDPLRILRLARFSAKFPDFSISEDTITLMKDMVEKGEINDLTPERVTKETIKALKEERPSNYFKCLEEIGALEKIMPEVSNLHGVIQPEEHHPEIDSFVHTMMTLDRISEFTSDPITRFGALVHDLGKAVTPKEMLPKHHGHEEEGVPIVEKMCNRLKFPKKYMETGMMASEHHTRIHRMYESRAKSVDKFFRDINLEKNGGKEKLDRLLLISEADARGRKNMEDKPYYQADYVKRLSEQWLSISKRDIIKEYNITEFNPKNIDLMNQRLNSSRQQKMKRHIPKHNESKTKSIDLNP